MTVVHDFDHSLAKCNDFAEAPWWIDLYRRAFPDLATACPVRKDGFAQRGGVDRILQLQSGKIWKVDEKVRDRDYPDILLERFSDYERRSPGWIQKPLECDFIAYIFVPSATCYLLPVAPLQLAWKQHGRQWITDYGERRSESRKGARHWSTLNTPVPTDVLLAAIAEAMVVHFPTDFAAPNPRHNGRGGGDAGVSYDALDWAARQDVGSPTGKLILLALAHYANGKALAWPSIAELVSFSGIHRKGVMRELSRLVRALMIEDSGERRGKTGQVKVWRLRSTQGALLLPRKGVRTRTVPTGQRPSIRDSLTAKESLPGNGSSGDRKSPSVRTRNKLEQTSDTKVSDVGDVDPVKELFDLGVAVLMGAGSSEHAARSLVGKWRKERSDGEVLTGLVECRSRSITNPVEWLQQRFRVPRYVSKSGYEYRGTREQIQREAERRADWDTYWSVRRERKVEA